MKGFCIVCGKWLEEWGKKKGRQFLGLAVISWLEPDGRQRGPRCGQPF